MTALTPSPPRDRASTPVRRRGTALTTLGAVLTTLAVLAGAAATALLIAFGSDGGLDSGPRSLTTSTAALVTDDAGTDDVRGFADVLGRPTVRVTSQTGDPAGVFIGVGPADAVDDYLAGVEVDEVTDVGFDPFELAVTRKPGNSRAAPPGEQDFWLASASSPSQAELSWPTAAGDHRLVVMNADGSPGVVTSTRVQVELPHVVAVSVGALIGSALLAAGGIALLVVGIRRMAGASSGRVPGEGPATWPPADPVVRPGPRG
ncbi:hypothetical protein LY71_10764 [Geodermatophilus tzadiensis]|uniref:Uncharacterized protein n=1 Tax=Geodermatophilus tzadiensis TaxID=1137988 RepID=A0A2T0TTE4_9ACTN|nr:hypothetical protein [Geodermatophilus tzadiensis]PRY48982.1 hypothetical protein LY71_10764 [Geodermatophilus tzadiensis]